MKILLVHNFYDSRKPSGENVVFEGERDLLLRRGHDVRTIVRRSDALIARGALGTLVGAAATPWNPLAARTVRREVNAHRPEVVHAHNTFPLFSPAIFPAIGDRAARVLTLHNYRLFCPAAIPLRDGRPCTECLDGRTVWPALRHGCYRGSRLATLPLALNVAVARATSVWVRHVDAFVALTDFQRDLVISAGLPADRVVTKPNFYPGRPVALPWAERSDRVAFLGRLSEEKGVAHLLDAWTAWGRGAPELRLVGDGPLGPTLRARAEAAQLPVSFLGQVLQERAEEEIASARLVVVPSVCFEGFPMVLREAFALGTPVAVTALGSLPALVEHGRAGLVFKPGDAASLLSTVRAAWDDPETLKRLGAAARATFEEKYGEDANYAQLMAIYQRAIESCRERRRAGM